MIVNGIVIGIITCGIVIVSVARAGIVLLIFNVMHTDIIYDGILLRDGLFVLASTRLFTVATLRQIPLRHK